MDFKNKNVLVTGGTKGIGFATAKAFINAGASVWITGRSTENLKEAASQINSPLLKTVVSDISNLTGIAVLEKAIAESGNKIDILFLNAGIAIFSPIAMTSEADFDAQFNTNVKGLYFTLQKLIPHLADGSSVLFTSSTIAQAATMYSSAYAATKGAVNKIAQIAANELADRKIRVNIVSPGPINTPGLDSVANDDVKAHLASGTALKRVGKPEEIASTILFLASDHASFITGTDIWVDGGYVNHLLK
ncbi:oxidoreductase [Flavobacterium palustre]|uniref:Oxidoreductase n=1 Tax=Flavobacterium palustre TaxID=1476463 RepID=A0ABQ1HQN7_9FLAO|nr:SDR family oxidoreductase [Flavobacterium palustre]GGA85267.1 oxidoreductase [Flavobacterium palustre]